VLRTANGLASLARGEVLFLQIVWFQKPWCYV
jgi:hypothetical protein